MTTDVANGYVCILTDRQPLKLPKSLFFSWEANGESGASAIFGG